MARGFQLGTVVAVAVEHAGQFDRQWPANPVGDQKGSQLGFARLALQHQVHGVAGFIAAEARAGVLAAAHLGN